jgi:proteasome lid subunit RPN8/RPN11
MALRIPKTLLDQLRRHGEETYPHECCGVLLGDFGHTDGRVVRAVAFCSNARTDSPGNRYQIGSADLVRIQREAVLAGREIVGFYHSHPDHPAQWSATDLAQAHWTGCSYVIVSVEKARAVQTNSFLLLGMDEAKRFEDEVIEVTV